MVNVTVLQFSTRDPNTGEPIWPAQESTTISVPGNIQTKPGICYISISADADCRMGIKWPASASSTPILAETERDFVIRSAGAETLYFI